MCMPQWHALKTFLVPIACSGLLAAMEYMEENLEEWLGEELEGFGDDDYLVFDCPGQIELYSNSNVFRAFTAYLQAQGWQVWLFEG